MEERWERVLREREPLLVELRVEGERNLLVMEGGGHFRIFRWRALRWLSRRTYLAPILFI